MKPTHASFHLYRADVPVSAEDLPRVDGSVFIGVYVDPAGTHGRHRVGRSAAVVLSHLDERSSREAVLHPPMRDLASVEFTEQWHVAAEVLTHRGETNWSCPLWKGSRGEVDGPLIVMTTAGYVIGESFDFSRPAAFAAQVATTKRMLEGLSSTSLVEVFTHQTAAADGITLSVWADARSMVNSAYRTGIHADNLAIHREQPMFDRSSFTRARPIVSTGTWGGVDPLATTQIFP